MKILVFSDTHFTKEFSLSLFTALQNTIKKADLVVINGDFWDAFLINFDTFVTSRWSELFPLLKSKHAVYLYGNHDKRSFCDSRVSLFSDIQQDRYEYSEGSFKLIITHGHTISPSIEDQIPSIFNNKAALWIGSIFNKYTTLYLGKGFSKIYEPTDRRILEYKRKHIDKDTYLISGHSHYQIGHKKDRCYNSGTSCGKFIEYTLIDTKKEKVENSHEKL